MFATNEKNFSVSTTYDPAMPQYTTKLQKADTKEYREREERASRMALEIQNQENFTRNEESDLGDEESQFSAVVRPSEANGGGATNKYIPPHLRQRNAQEQKKNWQQKNNNQQTMPSSTADKGKYNLIIFYSTVSSRHSNCSFSFHPV